jgi:hypothetical protein
MHHARRHRIEGCSFVVYLKNPTFASRRIALCAIEAVHSVDSLELAELLTKMAAAGI